MHEIFPIAEELSHNISLNFKRLLRNKNQAA